MHVFTIWMTEFEMVANSFCKNFNRISLIPFPFSNLNCSLQVAILAELRGSNKASDKLLMVYYPFLGLSVLAILRGLLPNSSRTTSIGKRPLITRKKRAWNLSTHHLVLICSLFFPLISWGFLLLSLPPTNLKFCSCVIKILDDVPLNSCYEQFVDYVRSPYMRVWYVQPINLPWMNNCLIKLLRTK